MANGTGHAKKEYLCKRLNKQREENSCQSIRRLLQILQIALAKVNRPVHEYVCVFVYVCVCVHMPLTHIQVEEHGAKPTLTRSTKSTRS